MYNKDIEVMTNLAKKKYNNADKYPGKYIMRAIVTGFYVIVAIILSYTTAGILNPKYPEVAKITVAGTFSLALALIVFLNGELFTGNNLIMCSGIYAGETTFKMAFKVWIYSYFGNLIGSIIISYIFIKSGASFDIIRAYIEPIINTKISLGIPQLILRGILCNFIVCLGVLATIKIESDSGKLIMMFWCVFAFAIAGFEHSIANMGIFSVGFFALDNISLIGMIRNIFWVTIGNVIGGGILLGFPTVFISVDE